MSRTLIIDGYNLLLGAPRYAADVESDIDTARDRLVADLGARAADGQQVIVVFDGAGNPHSDGQPVRTGGVTVIFSPSGTDADTVIESLAASARESGQETEVVTSDSATRWTSLGGSVIVTRASAFACEIDADESAWRSEGAEAASGRGTVSDRLDDTVRNRLDRMAGRRPRL